MITEQHINSTIAQSTFLVMPDGVTTICQLILMNGFSVIGTSACIDPRQFDLNIGRDIAFQDAKRQIWKLEGYLAIQEVYLKSLKDMLVKASDKPAKKAPKKAGKASYGLKADGTPKRKPGRPPKASQPAPVQPAVETPQPAEAVTEVA
jgi:hypothetical protein